MSLASPGSEPWCNSGAVGQATAGLMNAGLNSSYAHGSPALPVGAEVVIAVLVQPTPSTDRQFGGGVLAFGALPCRTARSRSGRRWSHVCAEVGHSPRPGSTHPSVPAGDVVHDDVLVTARAYHETERWGVEHVVALMLCKRRPPIRRFRPCCHDQLASTTLPDRCRRTEQGCIDVDLAVSGQCPGPSAAPSIGVLRRSWSASGSGSG